MLGDLQPEAVGPCPFTGAHIFPLDIAVHQFGDSFLVGHAADNHGHVRQFSQLAGPVAPVSGDNFIPALRVRPHKPRLSHPTHLYGSGDLLHDRVVVPHLIGLTARHNVPQARIAFEWVKLRERDADDALLLFGERGCPRCGLVPLLGDFSFGMIVCLL